MKFYIQINVIRDLHATRLSIKWKVFFTTAYLSLLNNQYPHTKL